MISRVTAVFCYTARRSSQFTELQQPDFNKPFELLLDAASKQDIAVILCQRESITKVSMPIYFAYRSISPAEKNYSVQELEALAVFWGIKQFRAYLECRKFTVFSDHASLQWFLKPRKKDKVVLQDGQLNCSNLTLTSFTSKEAPMLSQIIYQDTRTHLSTR